MHAHQLPCSDDRAVPGAPHRPGVPGSRLRIQVRTTNALELESFVVAHGGSFPQLPQWAAVKAGWRHEHLLFVDGDGHPVAAGLVLFRTVPGTPRSLAYLPEGPVLRAGAGSAVLGPVLEALAGHTRERGAFAVRIGPRSPVRSWTARTVRTAFGGPAADLGSVTPDVVHPDGAAWVESLRERGWTPSGQQLGDGQPRHVVVLELAGRDEHDLLLGMNQQWRRNLARAQTRGVVVRAATVQQLPGFWRLYQETATRNGFQPRSLEYLERLVSALGDRARLHLAELDGEILAGAITVRVGRTEWYLYGGSSGDRSSRPANALHWRIIRQALATGAVRYDLRGVVPALDERAPSAGLLRFKAGLGGTTIEYVGEWELALRPLWHRAYRLYRERVR